MILMDTNQSMENMTILMVHGTFEMRNITCIFL